MAPTVTPVLVYDRIAQNRRKTIVLVIITILMIIPFIGGISFGLAQYTVTRLGHNNSRMSQQERLREEAWKDATPGYQHEMEQQWETISKMREMRAEDESLRWRLTIVFAAAVTGILGLLFWSLASSPTSQVLAMCGARPAGPSEAEARRLLENLSIGAGLPPPKLYVIDSPVPNAFAAGMDPSRSVVAVTNGLLTLLDHRELEGVLAHELSHIGNRDTRLNTVVTSIVVFMRLPYLMRQRAIQARRAARAQGKSVPGHFRNPLRVLASPIYLYVFFIAPALAAAIRAAISRSREFQADADAALLTRYPEGLLRALAKIRGAGSAMPGPSAVISHLYFSDPSQTDGLMSLFRGNVLATHPTIEQRLSRLMEFNGGVPMSVLEAAAKAGVEFAKAHPTLEDPSAGVNRSAQDELSVLTTGSPMGRVFRVLSPTNLYDQPDVKSPVVARVKEGDLVVVFDDPGKFRQVLTHDQTFGYMPLAIKLQRVDMLPAEIHDPAARAAVQAAQVVAPPVAEESAGLAGLTQRQIAITTAFGILLFAGIFLALLKFGGN